MMQLEIITLLPILTAVILGKEYGVCVEVGWSKDGREEKGGDGERAGNYETCRYVPMFIEIISLAILCINVYIYNIHVHSTLYIVTSDCPYMYTHAQ